MADERPKSFHLDAAVHGYLVAHSAPLTAVHTALIDRTSELGGIARMQIAPEQGAFMTILTRTLGVTNAVEVGTFTGYSALCIASGLAAGGRLLCCDVSEEWTALGRDAWEAAGVADRIDLRLAPAIETLRALPASRTIDLAFIDADKPSYRAYWEELVPRMRVGGVILVDNVLWSGRVADPTAHDDDTEAIRAFNDAVAADARVDAVMLPISDGLTFARVH
jgi:caffeoyl-CoA O-methyltransferase